MATAKQEKQDERAGRQEGSRWINRRPTGEEFAEWFRGNVFLHEGMEHAPFLPGITLIPNKEKVREVRLDESGAPKIVEVEQLVYTPYPMVDARVDYWWKWRLLHMDWIASLKPLARDVQSPHLPEHFFNMPVIGADGRTVTPFVGVTYEAVMRQPGRNGMVIVEGLGTKIVPLLKRNWNGVTVPDEDAIAKAETGAKGRALGAAGILIIPGAGIATAEDMLDFLAGATEAPPTLPVTGDQGAETGQQASNLPELVKQLTGQLQSDHPDAYEEARAWAHEKGYSLDSPPEPALRGLERTLRRKLTEAINRQPPEKPAEAPPGGSQDYDR